MPISRRNLLRILAASCSPVFAQAPQGMASRGVKAARRAKFSGVPFHASLTDVARQAGLREVVVSGHPERCDYITEAMGCGAAFFDYDNDTDLDLAIVNGDVIDNIDDLKDQRSYKQVNLLLQNDGSGKFKEVGPVSGPGFALKKASRGLAVGDIDNDGDLDLLIANVGDTTDLLRNDGGNRQNSLLIRTVGTKSNRDGIGARLRLTIGKKVLLRYVKAGSSYLSQNDLRVHFGLGSATRADRLEILWPSGVVDEVLNIDANQIVTVREGAGAVSQKEFSVASVAR